MGSNSFGTIFKITTWGESHGRALGVVIDGCPAGLSLSESEINQQLALRQPGKSAFTSPRKEEDKAEIYSGLFEGKTTGAPISILIMNKDADPSKYTPLKDKLRPGHANFTYLEKYGIFDYRGGGRASGRETVCRVAAGAVAKKLLAHYNIEIAAYIKEIGGISLQNIDHAEMGELKTAILQSPVFCPDTCSSEIMMAAILAAKEEKDSLGGIVEAIATSLPAGLGDPIYEKLQANLAKAMFTLPAVKGFEIGSGFSAAKMQGSTHNDLFSTSNDKVITKTNFAGGILGGISTGMPLLMRVAFKPPSSIQKPQETLDLDKQKTILEMPEGSRHDPCLAIRAVPVVEAMCALVLADSLLMNRTARL
ncbi:MAG TPA: chorismate synthase [Rhabdochlamydiaceae bacterium]|nr:chorismate synthase [Rhabdochlamydiaceae bacterium]